MPPIGDAVPAKQVVDDLVAQAEHLEDLGAAVRGQGRDAHLREDLEQALLRRRADTGPPPPRAWAGASARLLPPRRLSASPKSDSHASRARATGAPPRRRSRSGSRSDGCRRRHPPRPRARPGPAARCAPGAAAPRRPRAASGSARGVSSAARSLMTRTRAPRARRPLGRAAERGERRAAARRRPRVASQTASRVTVEKPAHVPQRGHLRRPAGSGARAAACRA